MLIFVVKGCKLFPAGMPASGALAQTEVSCTRCQLRFQHSSPFLCLLWVKTVLKSVVYGRNPVRLSIDTSSCFTCLVWDLLFVWANKRRRAGGVKIDRKGFLWEVWDFWECAVARPEASLRDKEGGYRRGGKRRGQSSPRWLATEHGFPTGRVQRSCLWIDLCREVNRLVSS